MVTTREMKDNIKNELQIQNVSLHELSEKTGIKESLLHEYIDGEKDIRTDVLLKIAHALSVNVYKFLGEPYETKEDAYRICKEQLLIYPGSQNMTDQQLDELVHIIIDRD